MAKLTLKDTRVIRGSQLAVGMKTVGVDEKGGLFVDEYLSQYAGSCDQGIHFRSHYQKLVCFDRGALQRVVRD